MAKHILKVLRFEHRKVFKVFGHFSTLCVKVPDLVCYLPCKSTEWFLYDRSVVINPFLANVSVLCPLKSAENLWLQGVYNGSIGQKWVKEALVYWVLSLKSFTVKWVIQSIMITIACPAAYLKPSRTSTMELFCKNS